MYMFILKFSFFGVRATVLANIQTVFLHTPQQFVTYVLIVISLELFRSLNFNLVS